MDLRRAVFLLFAFLLILVLSRMGVSQVAALNWLAKDTISFLTSRSPVNWEPTNRLSIIKDCRANWYLGLVAQRQGRILISEQVWMAAIYCDPIYIPMLEKLIPSNQRMAALSVIEHPGTAFGWLWVAKLNREEDPNEAIALYRKGLELAPQNGVAWRELGDLLLSDEPHMALQAYLQSCFNGDPGSHGCWLAGQTAEQLGELENAIRYYRFSHWDGALQRARELQVAIPDATQP